MQMIKTLAVLEALVVLGFAPKVAEATACTSSIADMFATGIATGERAYMLSEDAPGPGATAGANGETAENAWNMKTQCLVKNEAGLVTEPSAEFLMQRSMFWIFSKLACLIMQERGIGTAARRQLQSGSGESGSGESGSGVSITSAPVGIGQIYLDECRYPQDYISAETRIDERGTAQGSWYGPLMQFPSINGEQVGVWSFDESAVHTHAPIDGVSSNVCTIDRGMGDDGWGGARRNTETYYDGGVQMTITRGSFLTLRAFQFKNSETRDAAVAAATDTLNPGLQYASTFAGSHGCDVEIVFEVNPMIRAPGLTQCPPSRLQLVPSSHCSVCAHCARVVQLTPSDGGGVEMLATLPFEAMTEEREIGIRSAVAVYQTADETIVLVETSALLKSQGLIDLDDTSIDGYTEMIRFSRTFVCKATGARVEASLTFDRADGSSTTSISTSASAPTLFQTDPPSTVVMHQAAGFRLSLTAEQAPTSCETMYWDPLLQTVQGPSSTGSSSNTTGGGGGGGGGGAGEEDEEPCRACRLQRILIPAVAGGVAVLAIIVLCLMKRNKMLCWAKPNGGSSRAAQSV